MKYLCLVYFEPAKLDAVTQGAAGIALTNDSLAYDEGLMREGKFIAAEALQSTDAAFTVRTRNGEISTTDGPFAETKEVLGGFILIDARDRAEAIRIAAGIPLARIGSIEVRPVLQMEKK
jgi:hypothetical protein